MTVTWTIEYLHGVRWAARNTSTETATGVQVAPQTSPLVRFDTHSGTIPPDGALTFGIMAVAQQSAPTEIWLTWNGQPEPVTVPIPPH